MDERGAVVGASPLPARHVWEGRGPVARRSLARAPPSSHNHKGMLHYSILVCFDVARACVVSCKVGATLWFFALAW